MEKTTNKELTDMFKKSQMTRIIRTQRATWLVHIALISEQRIVKMVLDKGEVGEKRRGRPKKKCYKRSNGM